MRIKELDIRRYGPLPEFPRQPLSNFTLFYGKNEHGKTLLIDAIIRILFDNKLGRGRKGFDALKRVADRPDGSVILERGDKAHVIARGTSINDCIQPEISISDFRNIFVIRDSAVEIVSDDGFYTQVSEKFTDIRTGEIRLALNYLQERGRLTTQGELSGKREAGHAARKVDTAESLVGSIDALVAELKAEQFDLLERRLVTSQETIASLERERQQQQAAATRAKRQEARGHLDSLVELRTRLSVFETLSEDELAQWRTQEEQAAGHRRDIERLSESLQVLAAQRADARSRLERAEDRRAVLDKRKQLIAGTLRPAIRTLRKEREKMSESRPLGGIWRTVSLLSCILLILAVTVVVVRGSSLFTVVATLCFLALIWSGTQLILQARGRGRIERDLERLLQDAAPIHEQGRSLTAVEKSVIAAEDECERETRARLRRQQAVEDLERRISGERGERERKRAHLAECEKVLEEIAAGSRMNDREEYRRALDEKLTLISAIRKLEGVLESVVGPAGDADDPVAFWRSEIDREIGDDPGGEEYDPARLREIAFRIEEEERAAAELRSRLRGRRDELGQIAYRVNEAAILENDPVRCRSVGDLLEIRDRLARFREMILDEMHTARETIALFQAIEREEKSRVAELFGPGRAVTEYFSGITEDFYEEVRFDPVSERISVKPRGSGALEIEALSGGTLDQLYFSIRLSLGARLLGGEPGFFLLDDPFIKADHERLELQGELLRRLVSNGWQILYFSAKREVRELFAGDIAGERMTLIPLPAHV